MEDVSGVELPLQVCVVGAELCSDREFLRVCSQFGHPVTTSSDGGEWMCDTSVRTVYIVPQFSGTIFDRLSDARKPILGPPAVKDLVQNQLPLLVKKMPVYCLPLYGCVIIFSGYRRKADLERLLKLIHRMGGSVQKDVGKKMTQLLAVSSLGDKYQYATTFSIPVLTEAWLAAAWDNREAVGHRATSKEEYLRYRLPPFQGNTVQFYGFESEELQHMVEVLVANGGRVASGMGSNDTTHLVVDENNVDNLPDGLEVPDGCHVVKGEWFWNSIQIEAAADVAHYKWRRGDGNTTATLLSPNRSCSVFSPPTPQGGATPSASNRKRKRLRRAEMIQSLAADSPAHKRRSSVSDPAQLSMSRSFLDTTDKEKDRTLVSPENSPQRGNEVEVKVERGAVFDMKTATPRQQVFHEFVTTETNYVAILECISKISSEAEDPSQQGGALLDQQEMKIIFGMMPPILKVHSDMLKKLVEAESQWSEKKTVGTIILQFAEDLLKAYPPFVNFFERTKNHIQECDRKNPRFHAFLKKCERRPECSRQTLTELMIRPVQRLPSISLLLNDLLKHTRKTDAGHPDCMELEKALLKIKEVMTHLNEEKRRTEGQIHIFDIYSEIENCPASVVSSHRSFVCRADCIEVAAEDALCGKGYELTLFLFTDIMVVAKRKSTKGMSMMRSPSTASLAAGQQHMLQNKALKFVTVIHLSAVRRLVDVIDSEDCNATVMSMASTATLANPTTNSALVAIVCRLTEDLRERCYTLQLVVDNVEDKLTFLRTVCRHVSNTLCRPDPDQLLVQLSARDMSLDASDLNVSSFSKALSSFHKTKQKVGRAFSFNKTPSKLKRAVSTVISPIAGSRNNPNTPSESMSELRLEDCGSEMSKVSPAGSVFSTDSREGVSPGSYQGGPRVSPYGLTRQDTVSNFCLGQKLEMEPIAEQETSVREEEESSCRTTPLSSRASSAQSCVDLMETESPRGSRLFPKKFNLIQESPKKEHFGSENRDPDFRTPNLCSRPSFRDKFRARPRAGTLGAFSRKNSVN